MRVRAAADDPFDPVADPVSGRLIAGLAKIGLVLRHHAWREGWDRGLTPTQQQALALLRRRGKSSMGISEVADSLAVTPATASDMVAVLVSKELVRKRRSRSDSRAWNLTLTVKGRRAADRALQWPDFLIGAIAGLSADEQRAFLRALVKIIRSLQEQGRISVSGMCVTCCFFQPRVYSDMERPHHCKFVNAPFGDYSLRLDCPDHEPAKPEAAERAWQAFVSLEEGKEE